MADTPYPLPRSDRRTELLVGNGGAVYGPFAFGCFDAEDVKVWIKTVTSTGGYVPQEIVAEKLNPGEAYSDFTVTFPANVPNTSQFYVETRRVHERSVAVTRGGVVDSLALELELSKQASVSQELRRDMLFGVGSGPSFDLQSAVAELTQRMDTLELDQDGVEVDVARAVKVPPTLALTAAQLVDLLLAIGGRDLGQANINPVLRADGTPLQDGDYYWNTLADEHRRYRSGSWVSFLLPNSSPSNSFASNPVLASGVSGTVNAIVTGFTPQLPAGDKFIRVRSNGPNTQESVTISVDGGAQLPMIRNFGLLQVGDTGPLGYIMEILIRGGQAMLLNPFGINVRGYTKLKRLTGSGTYPMPAGCYAITVHVIGGGGAGGPWGAPQDFFGEFFGSSSGSGGGGGGCAIKTFVGLPGWTFNYVCGSGGIWSGTSSAFTSTPAGSSTFTDGIITVTGGAGQNAQRNNPGISIPGNGGVASNGDVNLTGQAGGLPRDVYHPGSGFGLGAQFFAGGDGGAAAGPYSKATPAPLTGTRAAADGSGGHGGRSVGPITSGSAVGSNGAAGAIYIIEHYSETFQQ